MTVLVLLSNGEDVYRKIFSSVPSSSPRPTSSPLPREESPTPAPLSSSSTLQPAKKTRYQDEVNAAIERKLKTSQHRERQKSQQRQSDARIKNGNAKTNSKTTNFPNSPQSTELYQQMETKIAQLRNIYQTSKSNPNAETKERYLSAITLADYLKHRDTVIHDGGTYQMEAIEVYHDALNTLQSVWREMIRDGQDTRQPTIDIENIHPSTSNYQSLNRELFLDNPSKSIEGLLCATHTNLAKTYFLSNMFERAVDSYDECLAYDTSYMDALTYRAQAYIILGRYAEAGRDYSRVLEMDRDRIFVDAVTGLAKVLSAKEEDVIEGGGWDWDTLVQLIEREMPVQEDAYEASEAANNSAGEKHYADSLKRMNHAMFAYHDGKTKDAASAWKYLKAGNEYKMKTVAPFNANLEKERVKKVAQIFTPEFFPENIGSSTKTPIFIIGFVRSGSTLLERILDAHPLIVGTGEDSVFNGRLDYIRNEIVKASVSGNLGTLHSVVKKLADDVVLDMRKRWEVIDANARAVELDEGNEDAPESTNEERHSPTRFTDKMLTNYMNVGFIHLLFPNALILHVAREPMDTIFSAFKHDFPPGGFDYTSEFSGLAQLYHSYRDVMEHWDKVLPGRVTHVRYEDMATDLPNIAPKIIEAAGVPWDPTVLDFHKKKHAVNTLSTTQVRKGVYSHHFKGWKRYEEFLGPLLKKIGGRVNYDMKTTLPGYVRSQ